jgi:hypothetical protein
VRSLLEGTLHSAFSVPEWYLRRATILTNSKCALGRGVEAVVRLSSSLVTELVDAVCEDERCLSVPCARASGPEGLIPNGSVMRVLKVEPVVRLPQRLSDTVASLGSEEGHDTSIPSSSSSATLWSTKV